MKLLFLSVLLFTSTAFSQTATTETKPVAPSVHFRLEFVTKELDGAKVINSRTYVTTTGSGDYRYRGSIRSGAKVPDLSNAGKWLDVGFNVDCTWVEWNEQTGTLSAIVQADLTSLVGEFAAKDQVLRENRWAGGVVVPLGKPTVLFMSDDIATKHQIQVELTAKRL